MLSLITPTRNRPEAFAHVLECISRQDYSGELEWVIVCDGGADSYRFPHGAVSVIVRDPSNDPPGMHSLNMNLLAGLEHVQGDAVAMIEDDEHYSRGYLSAIAAGLEQAPLVGLAPSFYYHVQARKGRNMNNRHYASLACTGLTREVFSTFEQGCRLPNPFIDGWLWCHWTQTLVKPYLLLDNLGPDGRPLSVGLKGCKGLPGIGTGHSPHGPGWVDDPDGRLLAEWIGGETHNYCDVHQ